MSALVWLPNSGNERPFVILMAVGLSIFAAMAVVAEIRRQILKRQRKRWRSSSTGGWRGIPIDSQMRHLLVIGKPGTHGAWHINRRSLPSV